MPTLPTKPVPTEAPAPIAAKTSLIDKVLGPIQHWYQNKAGA